MGVETEEKGWKTLGRACVRSDWLLILLQGGNGCCWEPPLPFFSSLAVSAFWYLRDSNRLSFLGIYHNQCRRQPVLLMPLSYTWISESKSIWEWLPRWHHMFKMQSLLHHCNKYGSPCWLGNLKEWYMHGPKEGFSWLNCFLLIFLYLLRLSLISSSFIATAWFPYENMYKYIWIHAYIYTYM